MQTKYETHVALVQVSILRNRLHVINHDMCNICSLNQKCYCLLLYIRYHKLKLNGRNKSTYFSPENGTSTLSILSFY